MLKFTSCILAYSAKIIFAVVNTYIMCIALQMIVIICYQIVIIVTIVTITFRFYIKTKPTSVFSETRMSICTSVHLVA